MTRTMRYLLLSSLVTAASALSASSADSLQLARGRLQENLKSLSGKLTLSPEIDIPEPSSPTAMLLQSTAITELSSAMRKSAKANAAFLSGSHEAVQTFCNEQETARGNFPGPLPIISSGAPQEEWEALAEVGVSAVLLKCSLDDLADLGPQCEAACAVGLQPIPELVLQEATSDNWSEESFMEDVVAKLTETMGQEPAALLVAVQETTSDEETDEPREPAAIPPVAKSLTKKLPIIGSIAVMAGGNRMGSETLRFKAAGYTGAVLRSGCLPPTFTEDLEMVTRFWSSCIGELKSTKSKNFEFRTRNYLEKSTPVEWAKYQKSVIESGALGSPEEQVSINSDGGDYTGF